MSNIMLIVLAAFLAFIIVLYLLYQHTASRLSESEMKNNEYEHTIVNLEAENARLSDALNIISKNRSETNEKINELHNGDSVINAINGLCKH